MSKATKLQKLVTRATDVEIQNREYPHEARDNGYHFIPLHAPFNGRWWRRWRLTILTKKLNLSSSFSCTSTSKYELFSVIYPCHEVNLVRTEVYRGENHHARRNQRWPKVVWYCWEHIDQNEAYCDIFPSRTGCN